MDMIHIRSRTHLLISGLKSLKPRLHLPRSSYDFSVCDFPYGR